MSSFVLEPERSLVPLFAFLAILTSAAIFRHINRSSLNQVPHAHWSCGVSSAWVLWQRYRGKELKILEAKHRKLGPILRVGPADLSINSYEHGVRPIYNGSFEKPEYFRFYRYYGRKTSFSSMKRHDHSMRRKRVSAALAKTALFTSEPLRTTVDQILYQRLLPLIEGHQGLSLDILPLCYALSLDALTSTLLGAPAGTKYLLDLPSVGLWLENYELMYCKQAFWPQELPGWTRALRKIGVDMLPRSYYTSREALEEWLLEICDRAELDITVMNPTGLSKEPASLYQVLKAAVEIDSPQMSREEQRLEIASELFDQISGAREVLGLVLAYTILYISQNPDAQEKLRNEVLACMPRAKSEDATYHDDRGGDAELKEAQSPAPASLDRLPYLSAVLKESFRMRPNSTPLPRVTPQDRSVSLAGFEIPPSTRVNVFQWFIHRNPETFDCVDEWHPERWISDSGTLKVGSDQPLWAFGSGSRMCVGASLSQYLMKHTLAAIYSRFSSKIVAKKQNVQEPGSLEDEIIVVFESL